MARVCAVTASQFAKRPPKEQDFLFQFEPKKPASTNNIKNKLLALAAASGTVVRDGQQINR